MRDELEQRQIVMRVAVEPRIRERAAVNGHPLAQPCDLARPETRLAGDLAGETPITFLGFGGDQMRDAEFSRNR